MLIETKNNLLKHRNKKMDLSEKEKKLILILSDNRYHKTREMRKYVGFVTELQTRLLIKKLNKRAKEMFNMKNLISKKENKHGITGWDLFRIARIIYIS